MSKRDPFVAGSRTGLLAIGLLASAIAGCEMGAAEVVREIDAARGECSSEGLRASDEECVRMMQRFAEMGTALIHTYIGGVRTLDMALDRMPPPRFDTTGPGLALSPEFRQGALPGAAGASPRLRIPANGLSASGVAPDRTELPTNRRDVPSTLAPVDPARDRVESRYRRRDDFWGFSTGGWNGGAFGGSGAYRDPLAPWIGGGRYSTPYGFDSRYDAYGYGGYTPGNGGSYGYGDDPRYSGSYGYGNDPRYGSAYGYGGYDPRYGGSYGYDPRYERYGYGEYDPYGGAYGYGGYDPRYGGSYGYGYDPRYGSYGGYGYGGYDPYGGAGYGGYDPYGGYGYGAYDSRYGGTYGYGGYDPCHDARVGYDGYDPRCGAMDSRGVYGDAGYGPTDPYAADDPYGDGLDGPYGEQPPIDDASVSPVPARPAPHQPGILLPPSERLRRPWLND